MLVTQGRWSQVLSLEPIGFRRVKFGWYSVAEKDGQSIYTLISPKFETKWDAKRWFKQNRKIQTK
jgi:hypothetical protein